MILVKSNNVSMIKRNRSEYSRSGLEVVSLLKSCCITKYNTCDSYAHYSSDEVFNSKARSLKHVLFEIQDILE